MERPPAPDIPLSGDEPTLVAAFLDFYRAALLDRAWGLTAQQLAYRHPPSRLSLAGLIAHMAFVEYIWFAMRLDDDIIPEPFASLDFDADIDAEMTYGETLEPDDLFTLFDTAVADARARTAAAGSFDALTALTGSNDQPWNLRWIMLHMIEEYARHVGHADLIREAIDGDTAS